MTDAAARLDWLHALLAQQGLGIPGTEMPEREG
jgi:hypothetical protein